MEEDKDCICRAALVPVIISKLICARLAKEDSLNTFIPYPYPAFIKLANPTVGNVILDENTVTYGIDVTSCRGCLVPVVNVATPVTKMNRWLDATLLEDQVTGLLYYFVVLYLLLLYRIVLRQE